MPKRNLKLPLYDWTVLEPLKIQAVDWQRMETALGTTLNDWAIDDIRDATQAYVVEADIERAPSHVAEAIHDVTAIRQKTRELRELCSSFGRAPKDAPSYARYQINYFFDDAEFPNWRMIPAERYPLERLTGLLAALDKACEKSIDDLNDPNLHRFDGDAWCNWIVELTQACDRNSLPTAARKDSERNSPFVAFLRELQLSLPSQYRRHMHSNSALAAAIHKARRTHRDS